jgi:hypothetical protein
VAVFLALLAAAAFALGSVLQQKGTLETTAGEDDPRFLAETLRRPVWLLGAGAQGSGWILQAMALDRGSMVVVQSLCTLSLVIALPLGVRLTDQVVTRGVMLGAIALVAGIVVFLSIGNPAGGTASPASAAWWSSGLSTLVLIAVLWRLGQRRHGAIRALSFGAAAGLSFAYQAAVTKAFVPLVGQGARAMVTSWTVYVLIVSALIGFVLQQSALKTGVLAPALASSNAMTLLGSVVLGITLFGESVSGDGGGHTAAAVLGLALAVVGVVALARGPAPAAAVRPVEDVSPPRSPVRS